MYFGHLLPTIEELIYRNELMTIDQTVSINMKSLVPCLMVGM